MKSKIWPQQPRKWPLDLNDLEMGSANFFKNYIFKIRGSSWEKWAVARLSSQTLKKSGFLVTGYLLRPKSKFLLVEGTYYASLITPLPFSCFFMVKYAENLIVEYVGKRISLFHYHSCLFCTKILSNKPIVAFFRKSW